MASSDRPDEMTDSLTPRIINLPRFLDHRGNLSVVEQCKDIPFPIRRVYWVYDVPGGEEREGHAYFRNHEFIVALSGSFDVITDDGREVSTFPLNRSYYGLYVPAGTWRSLTNFSTNSLALVVASTPYDPDDYIYTHDDFTLFKQAESDMDRRFPISSRSVGHPNQPSI